MKAKTLIVVIVALITFVPVFLFFLEPEVNLNEKYIRLSWARSSRDLQSALDQKKPGEILKKIYDEKGIVPGKESFLEDIDSRFQGYSDYSRKKLQWFLKKWNDFIS